MPTFDNVTISGGISLTPPPPPPGSILLVNTSPGTYQGASYANNDALNMASGDFTIEWWVKYSNFTYYQTPWAKGFGTNPGIYLQANVTTGKVFYIELGNTQVGGEESGTNLSAGVWYHYALVRSGSTVTLYRDGTSRTSGTSSVNLTNTVPLRVGFPAQGGPGLNGSLSCLRIVKGTAVYTSNFSKPTSPPTAISGTSLLLLAQTSGTAWADSSTNNFTPDFTDSTSGTWSSNGPFS